MRLPFSAPFRLLSLASGLALLTVACGQDKTTESSANTLLTNDFESLSGWLGAAQNIASLTKEKAHSGHYSIKVDGTVNYSLTFAHTLGALHSTRMKKIKVTAWVWVPGTGNNTLLVTHLTDGVPDSKPLLWDGFNVEQAVAGKHNEWVQVSKVLTVPETANYETHIGLYLWRSEGAAPVYLDDLTVTVEPEA